MITAWKESRDAAVDDVRIVGHHWSAPSYKARDFLARNAVPYRWYSVEEPEGQRLLAAAEAGPDDVPVIVTPAGQVLRSPTPAELGAAVGLDVEPRTDFYDLVVVGGGPAGVGAAVYGGSEGPRPVRAGAGATRGAGGAAHRGRGEAGHWRSGRSEHPNQGLPRLPRRRLWRPAGRPGPAAGAEV